MNFQTLKPLFKGDIDTREDTLDKYSHDASLFEVRPQVVVYPKNTEDIKILVKWVNENKKNIPDLSITARAAGTDMSGGPLGNSIVVDFIRYMNKIIEVKHDYVVVEPGCFYRDFDKATRKIMRFMPAYTASREINAVGGMIGNNSGGEKSIKYGKVDQYVNSLKLVLSNANEYEIRPLNREELQDKINSSDIFEKDLYFKILDLINKNYEEIRVAKPNVSKNSAGYSLWDVYDNVTGKFDLCKLIIGSQGTLGLVSEINFKIVPTCPHSNILVVFIPLLEDISDLVAEILPFKPDSLETYDDKSIILAVRFFWDFFKQLGFWEAIKLGFQFIPEIFMILKGDIPRLILMVEFSGESEEEIKRQLTKVQNHINHFGFYTRIAKSSIEANKYWSIRHESFNLLRKHVKHKRTAPFIDDIIVLPEYLPEFLPKIKKLLDEYKLDYTVQGHLGDGNFHLIPLMDLDSPFSDDIILELSKKVYSLVHEYKGSITAEHNDGIIRTPFLEQQFGPRINKLFQEIKNIFDPLNIFNPNKKVGGTFEDIKKAIRKKN